MRAGRFGPARTEIKSANAVILFWVGPYRMGIPAAALKEIRSDCCATSPSSFPRKRESLEADLSVPPELGCGAILSAGALFGVASAAESRLLVLRSQNVAIRVDQVERMIEIGKLYPLPRAFQGAERSWYIGITLAGDLIIPLLNPETLASEAISQAAQRHAGERESSPSSETRAS
jgi:hypothetical protein